MTTYLPTIMEYIECPGFTASSTFHRWGPIYHHIWGCKFGSLKEWTASSFISMGFNFQTSPILYSM